MISRNVVVIKNAEQIRLGMLIALMLKGTRVIWAKDKQGLWAAHSTFNLTARRISQVTRARAQSAVSAGILSAFYFAKRHLFQYQYFAKLYLFLVRSGMKLPVAKKLRRIQVRRLTDIIQLTSPPADRALGDQFSLVLVSGTLGPGGAERQLVNTAVGLKGSGKVSVKVLCQYQGSDTSRFFRDNLESEGIDVEELSPGEDVSDELRTLDRFSQRALVALSYYSVRQISAYKRYFETVRPDVVHTWLDEVNVKAGIGAVLAGVSKVVVSTRSVAPHNFLIHRLYMAPGYLALATQPNVSFACNSNAGKRSYADWLSIPDSRISVIRNGFDPSYFIAPSQEEIAAWKSAHGLDVERPIVGTVTRFNEEKNPLQWIKFAAILAKENSCVQFVMIGGGPLLAKAKKFAVRAGLGSRIVFTGLVRDTRQGIAAMDVFILCSRLEGLPNAVIEAQSFGVPVVTTDAGGAPEAIAPGETGIVVGVGDAAGIARAVAKILDDHRWRAQAGAKARRFAANAFAMDRMIEETLALYRTRSNTSQVAFNS